MKKFFLCLMPLLMLLMAAVCTSCKGCTTTKGTDEVKGIEPVSLYHDYDGVAQDFTAGVAHIQALHRQTMFALNGGEYEWLNSKVVLSDTVTAATIDGVHVVSVTDVFQLWADGPVVQFISTDVVKGTILPWPIHDVWIEDASLNDVEIKVTAEQALQRLKEVNCPIPAAKSMSLRLPLGPCKCNAQWVVGDVYDVLFIDAVTGKVSNWNPAFNPTNGAKGGDFGKPLGEWP